MTTDYFSVDFLETPLGPLVIKASENGVTHIQFVDTPIFTPVSTPTATPIAPQTSNGVSITQTAKQQLSEYFSQQRQVFDFPLDLRGTDFQQAVWKSLLTIPYGETASYQTIANKLKNPKAVRAVGSANGRNPVGIVVPCHRVIGSNGMLTGYAGGLGRKSWLLDHEQSRQTSQQESLFDF